MPSAYAQEIGLFLDLGTELCQMFSAWLAAVWDFRTLGTTRF